ncbi:DOMON-like domain-containing protein [Oscillatoria sp. FACHB-1406]|uniref:DOMON-like domain-containing protein n=1 Tax=Oscillatoria sp. FACHB-1406 TaxID=2692846 RepID=UPI0018EF9EF4|nr:DOMON-like domain-containing protein [Oscillatoria sp. FACHB-1406]
MKSIELPEFRIETERKNELWKTTCFEFFLGMKKSSRYWEFNLSPSGDWNVYRFEDYRHGMEEERRISRLPFEVRSRDNYVALSLEFDLAAIVSEPEALEIAIASVIQTQTGGVTYWALKHCGTEADFHRRDSFVDLA